MKGGRHSEKTFLNIEVKASLEYKSGRPKAPHPNNLRNYFLSK